MPLSYPYKMSCWYGYDKDCTNFTSYTSSITSTSFGACFEVLNQTYYHNGSGSLPVVGDDCFSDSGGSSILAQGWYRLNNSTRYNINASGEITNIQSC